MTCISPIDSNMQQRVIDEVNRYRLYAESVYKQVFPPIDIHFDLRGKAAGMYRVRYTSKVWQRNIRFNPWLFAKYPEDSWENTIPHEVAHYLADCLYGLRTIRPHGKEWKAIMLQLGAQPIVRASYDMTDIPVRRVKRYMYRCLCRDVNLTSYRHLKIQRGLQRYQCRQCSSDLRYIAQSA